MSGEMVKAPSAGSLIASESDLLRARLEAALGRLAPSSRRAYGDALEAFATWLVAWLPTAPAAVRDALGPFEETDAWRAVMVLMSAGPLVAGSVVDSFASARPDLAPATRALRLAALRFTVRTARDAGAIGWTLNVRSPKVRALRDTRGPGVPAARRMLAFADAVGGLVGVRDGVVIALLLVLGLRRGEVVELDVGHVDVEGRRLSVLGKGRADREWLTLPPALLDRIVSYLALRERAAPDAPLIVSCARQRPGKRRLSANGLFRRVRWIARKAEVERRVSPHRLRHTGITAALDAFKGDVRRVRKFSRHAKIETVLVYDDARADMGGEVSAVVAGVVGLSTGR